MTDQTIPQAAPSAEAIEAAAKAVSDANVETPWNERPGWEQDAYRDGVRAALTAALPLLSVPEAVEVEDLRIAVAAMEAAWSICDDDRKAAEGQVERVRALADGWQKHHDESAPNAPSLIYGDGASWIRHALASPDDRPNRCPACGSVVWWVNPRGRCFAGWHADPTAARTPDDDAEGESCPCDGGSCEAKAHPFIVHPDCPIHAEGKS